MFTKEVYTMIAKVFATPIGIAEINLVPTTETNGGIGNKTSKLIDGITDTVSSKEGRMMFKDKYEEIRVNNIVLDAIKRNKYRVLMRGVYHQRAKEPLWSDRRVYSTVWRMISTSTKTKTAKQQPVSKKAVSDKKSLV